MMGKKYSRFLLETLSIFVLMILFWLIKRQYIPDSVYLITAGLFACYFGAARHVFYKNLPVKKERIQGYLINIYYFMGIYLSILRLLFPASLVLDVIIFVVALASFIMMIAMLIRNRKNKSTSPKIFQFDFILFMVFMMFMSTVSNWRG